MTFPKWALQELLKGQEGTQLANEAWRAAMASASFSVVDRDLSAAPASPADGAVYLVAGSPSDGIWDGQSGSLAVSLDGTQDNWAFRAPVEGDRIAVQDENVRLVHSGAAWVRETQLRIHPVEVLSPTGSDERFAFYTENAITIEQIQAVVRGTTPSVTWTVRHSTDRSAAGNEAVTGGTTTTSTTSGSRVTTFNDATIPAQSFVWLETTAASGTVDALEVAILSRRDRDW